MPYAKVCNRLMRTERQRCVWLGWKGLMIGVDGTCKENYKQKWDSRPDLSLPLSKEDLDPIVEVIHTHVGFVGIDKRH